jgi:hypothetical protein
MNSVPTRQNERITFVGGRFALGSMFSFISAQQTNSQPCKL